MTTLHIVEPKEDTSQQEKSNKLQPINGNLRPIKCKPSAAVLIPPVNFGLVEEGLYRSGQPTELNFPFLERLELRTLIWLAPEEPNQQFMNFVDEHNIRLYHLGVLTAANAWDPLTEEVVVRALELILNPERHPMIVMCNLGRHRTGTVMGCLRKLQNWNLASIFEEYRRYAGPKVRQLNEQFIELFDTTLVPVPYPNDVTTI